MVALWDDAIAHSTAFVTDSDAIYSWSCDFDNSQADFPVSQLAGGGLMFVKARTRRRL